MRPNTWTRAEHMLLVKMAQNGASYESICNALSRHQRTAVWHKLKNAGFTAICEQAPSANRGKATLHRQQRDAKISELYLAGQSPHAIAAQINMSETGVRSAIQRLGIYVWHAPGGVPTPGDLVQLKGLPKGHLKPWPATAKFTSLDVPADPHKVGATYRPDPSYSSGVAEYGHV